MSDIQRLLLHIARDLSLCDHMGDVADDVITWWRVFGLGDLPFNDSGIDLAAIELQLGCDGGRWSNDFKQLVIKLQNPEQAPGVKSSEDVEAASSSS